MNHFPEELSLWNTPYLSIDWEALSDDEDTPAESDNAARIHAQREQVVISLTAAQEIATVMRDTGKLTKQEFETIDEFHLTPLRANEELLAIIMKTPRDVYESFLSLLKKTKQYDVYQLLTRPQTPFFFGYHYHPILRNYEHLSSVFDVTSGLLRLLLENHAISYREYGDVTSQWDQHKRNEILLFIMCGKSSNEFRTFKKALKMTRHRIAAKQLTDMTHGRDIVLEHSRFIWQNYEFLTLSLDFDSTFLSRLVELQAISYREYGRLRSKRDRIQRNEALLDIIYRKSPDEFKRFKYAMEETHENISLKRLKDVTQGEQTVSDYSSFIRHNYKFFASNSDITSILLPELRKRQVISAEEHERIRSQKDHIQRNETLLSVVSRKPVEDVRKFIIVWEETFSRKDLTEWRLLPKARHMPLGIPDASSSPSLKSVRKSIKVTHPCSPSEPVDDLSELTLSSLFAEDTICSIAASVKRRSTQVLTDSFKKLPDELQMEVSTKVVFMGQSRKSTTDESLWDMCLCKMIQGFRMVKQPTHDFLIENAQYKAIIKENQLQVAELRETIRNMKLQTERLNARLLATETELDRQRDINCMYYQLRRPEKETKLPGQQMIKAYPQGMRGGRLSRPFNALGKEERDSIIDMFGRVEGMHVVTTPDKLIGKVGTHSKKPMDVVTTAHEVQKKLQQMSISMSLTKQQRNTILQKMKSFRFPNVSITTCIFEDDYIEFYFVLEDIPSIDKLHLVKAIVIFLNIDVLYDEKIKVTELKCKPKGGPTYSGPGNSIINMTGDRRTTTTLGAFVSIEGKGDHLLSCGHDKKVGDILSNDDDERIGTTRAVAYCTEDFQTYDGALANVDHISYAKSVIYEGSQLHLSATPVDPVKGTVVQRFPPQPMASRATIRHIDYNSFEHDVYGCIAIITDNRDSFHRFGESGLVVTSLPSEEFQRRVDPIGMLFFLEFVERTDDGRGYQISLAIPITKNLEKLREDGYCGGREISFLRDT